MARRINRRAALAAVVVLGAFAILARGWTDHAAGQGKAAKTETKVTAKASKPDADGKQVVTVTLAFNKPWYAYANPVGNETLEEAQTSIKITSKTKLQDVKI